MRFACLIVPLFALAASAADPPTAEEKAVIDAVAKLGGSAEVDARLPPAARVAAKFETATDAILVGLKKYPQVGAVDVFDATRCTDKGFAALKELPNLRRLVVGRAELSPASAAAVGQCKELRHLTLSGCGVTDAELASMKKLALLEYLGLSDNPKITDKGMATLRGFDRLQVLYLNKASITDKGLAELKPLDGLRALSVKGSRVTPDAAEKFADDMPNLRKVTW